MLDSPVQQIKERLDIVEVISSYIKLEKAGANYRALCPFHPEKTPSFFVSPARQIWHCFGACQTGGDVFKFVMQIEGMEFGDALRILAQKAGVELKRQDPKLITERKRLYEICELAAKFFEKQLQESKSGQEAKKYLLGRGITEGSIKKWRLGFAPDSQFALSNFLKGRGYEEKEAVKAGLTLRTENNIIRDRFRNRIIFPIFDFSSQVIGFGGRIFCPVAEIGDSSEQSPEDERTGSAKRQRADSVGIGTAKYINTPSTLLYDKSRTLYGLDRARIDIRKKDSCLLVEGYTDVIMSAQAGLENVVATSGTALTPYQLEILKRYSQNLVLAFDMDIAGDTATKRGIDLALTQGFNLKVIIMPKGKDPADIVAASPEDWGKLAAQAKDIIEFYFETTFRRFDKKTSSFRPEEKAEIAKNLLPVIKRIPNKILQSHWLSELAKKIDAKEEDLEAELKKYSSGIKREKQREEGVAQPSSPRKSRQEMLEEEILLLILQEPKILEILEKDSPSLFSLKFQEILKIFQKAKDKEETLSPKSLRGPDKESANFLDYLALKADFRKIKEPQKEALSCLQILKSLVTKKELEEISQEIRKAEESKHSRRIESLLERFNELTKKLKNLD